MLDSITDSQSPPEPYRRVALPVSSADRTGISLASHLNPQEQLDDLVTQLEH